MVILLGVNIHSGITGAIKHRTLLPHVDLGYLFTSSVVRFFTLKSLQNHFSGLCSLTFFCPLGCKQTWNYILASGQGSSWFCAMQRHGSEIQNTRALLKWLQWKLVSHQESFVCNSLSWENAQRRHFQVLFNSFHSEGLDKSVHITIPPPLLSPVCLECSLFLIECLAEVFGFCLFYLLHFYSACLQEAQGCLQANYNIHYFEMSIMKRIIYSGLKNRTSQCSYTRALLSNTHVNREDWQHFQEAWRFKMQTGLY